MEPTEIFIKKPGFRRTEYQLIISPKEILQEKIKKIQRYILDKYDNGTLMKKKPVLTLCRFISLEMMEDKLIQHFKVAAMGMPPFKLYLKDYKCLPNHSLFIKNASRIPMQLLMKELKTASRLIKTTDKKPFFNSDFALPVAVRLSLSQYKNIEQDFKRRQFTASFIADNMLLLKRREGEKYFQIAARLAFQNLPVTLKQGALF